MRKPIFQDMNHYNYTAVILHKEKIVLLCWKFQPLRVLERETEQGL